MLDPGHPILSTPATRVPLHLSVNVDDEWLEAIEFGQVVDGRSDAQLCVISDDVRLVLGGPAGPVVGFTVHRYAGLDLEALEPLAFGGPRFSIPALGLDRASLGEAVLAVRSRFDEPTADVRFFNRALQFAEDEGDLESAAFNWRACLQAGDMRGHFGLGYTYFDLGRHGESYDHLRRYTELAPDNAWAWLWLGRAAEALGELDEARTAYRTALRREREGSFRTDALERLDELDRRGGDRLSR